MSDGEKVDKNKLYTSTELAELAGLDASYIRRLLLQGRIRGKKVHKRLWLISGHEVERWLSLRRGE